MGWLQEVLHPEVRMISTRFFPCVYFPTELSPYARPE